MGATKVRNGQIQVTTDFDINSNKLTNVATPSSANDAANKAYVDSVATGLDWKASVRYATTGNITLSGTGTQGNGDWPSSLTVGDRILVKGQSTAADNGIYTAASGAWSRATDADSSAEVTAGMAVFVTEGSTLADTGWVLTTNDAITLGSTSLAFAQFSGSGVTAGAGLTISGSTIDVVSGNGGIVVNANDITLTAADASLSIGGSGIKVATGSSGQMMVSNGTLMQPTTISGDATINGSGVVSLASNVIKEADIVTEETPSGTINGSNTTFTLANTPTTGTVRLYLNGIRLRSGSGNDYTISTATITMATAPATGDILLADYFK